MRAAQSSRPRMLRRQGSGQVWEAPHFPAAFPPPPVDRAEPVESPRAGSGGQSLPDPSESALSRWFLLGPAAFGTSLARQRMSASGPRTCLDRPRTCLARPRASFARPKTSLAHPKTCWARPKTSLARPKTSWLVQRPLWLVQRHAGLGHGDPARTSGPLRMGLAQSGAASVAGKRGGSPQVDKPGRAEETGRCECGAPFPALGRYSWVARAGRAGREMGRASCPSQGA